MLVFVIMIGIVSINSVTGVKEVNKFITSVLSCTNFLVPKTNGSILSFKSLKKSYC